MCQVLHSLIQPYRQGGCVSRDLFHGPIQSCVDVNGRAQGENTVKGKSAVFKAIMDVLTTAAVATAGILILTYGARSGVRHDHSARITSLDAVPRPANDRYHRHRAAAKVLAEGEDVARVFAYDQATYVRETEYFVEGEAGEVRGGFRVAENLV